MINNFYDRNVIQCINDLKNQLILTPAEMVILKRFCPSILAAEERLRQVNNAKRVITDEEKDYLIQNRKLKTIRELANELNIGKYSIYAFFQHRKITDYKRHTNPLKLTEDDKEYIRRWYGTMSQTEMAIYLRKPYYEINNYIRDNVKRK